MPSSTKIALVAALAAAATPAMAFAPGSGLPMRASRPASGLSLKAAAEEPPKPTLGVASPLLEGNEQAEKLFGFLQSKSFIKEREGFLVGEMFADGCIRNSGFTEFSEKVNGRIAQVAFPLALGETFNGDVLTQLAESPVTALMLMMAITAASLPPVFEENQDDRRAASMMRVVVPPEINDKVMDAFKSSGMDKIFTEEAERTNSRAAMAAFGVWIATAMIF
eukprot:CAMPEP_0173434732 /NCGR_PEP_ID=MMETSP1357-20121228/13283_1 /TAXON_ID=77926 /ORGANISM="Hemiselmis rufescens, Strain PCC563" /LENGTH=221 /DNA_ID=CAMNT_0014399627 /DNA_START=11 /DNA_END=676 /DNA_ORIENTATION=-